MNGIQVGNIDQLHRDSELITNCSIRWNDQIKEVYTTVNELKESWEGNFSKGYTDAVDQIQPDLVDFANVLNRLSTTLTNVSNMFKAIEEQGDVRAAKLEEPQEFNLTELIRSQMTEGFKFDAKICREKAARMNEAAIVIEQIIDEVATNIDSINGNYQSDAGTEIIEQVRKLKDAAPNYVKAIKDCASALINVVAPQYEEVEKYVQNS